jgi:ribose transport system substrate-binding protein
MNATGPLPGFRVSYLVIEGEQVMSSTNPLGNRRTWRMSAACSVILLCWFALAGCAEDQTPSAQTPGSGDESSSADLPSLDAIYAGTEHEPPLTSPPPAKDINVWWINCGAASDGCNDPALAGEEAAKALGWDVTVYDAQFVNHSTGIRQAIADGADAIVTHGMDCSANLQALKEARDAGIAILGMEDLDCNEDGGDFDAYNVPIIVNKTTPTWTEYFENAWGGPMADYVVAKTNGAAKVIQVTNTEGFAKNIAAGQLAELDKCSGCEVVATVESTAVTQSDGTLTAKFKAALAAHPEANAVLYPWDTVVSLAGLSTAIKQAGRGDMIVVSEGGYAPTQELIRKGGEGLTAVNSNSAGIVGWSAMDALNRYFNGTPPRPEGLGFRMIDKENGVPASGGYVSPIDYKALFMQAWEEGAEEPVQ